MGRDLPGELEDLVKRSLAPGVVLDATDSWPEGDGWRFRLIWGKQPFILSVLDSWWEDKAIELIAQMTRLATPSPEATLSGKRFWLHLKNWSQNDRMHFEFSIIESFAGASVPRQVEIAGTVAPRLHIRAKTQRRHHLEHELSAAVTALKDALDRSPEETTIKVGSHNIEAILDRTPSNDRDVRRYLGAKLFQAYQSADENVELTFGAGDFDYLGVTDQVFRRAVSLVNGEDWDIAGLTLRPRLPLLKRLEEPTGLSAPEGSRMIFLCHAEADKPIATVLKHYFEKADRQMEVFQASHPASLPGGHEWWKEIRDALLRAPVVLTLVSPRSKDRPWLYFESGGAYFKGKLVIPLVVPPERKSLPPPLGVLQARDLTIKEDVAAVVKEVGQALKVTFVGSSEDLWAALRDASARLSESSSRLPEGTREGAQPWERQLRSLAARGTTVQVHPIVPPAFGGDAFEIGPIDDLTIGLIKQDSRHRIDIPPNRVIDIRKAEHAHVLDIHGRVQWIDTGDSWQYMPEDIDPKDPIGLGRVVDLQSQEVRALEKKLNADGWTTGFAHEIKARRFRQ